VLQLTRRRPLLEKRIVRPGGSIVNIRPFRVCRGTSEMQHAARSTQHAALGPPAGAIIAWQVKVQAALRPMGKRSPLAFVTGALPWAACLPEWACLHVLS